MHLSSYQSMLRQRDENRSPAVSQRAIEKHIAGVNGSTWSPRSVKPDTQIIRASEVLSLLADDYGKGIQLSHFTILLLRQEPVKLINRIGAQMRPICLLVLRISKKLYVFSPLSEMMMHLHWIPRMSNVRIVMLYFPHRMAEIYPRFLPSGGVSNIVSRDELQEHYLSKYCPGAAVAIYMMTRDR
ncbi:hypothetical protein PHISCL_01563 [Aspergillus sclerotialis]|uniref:Uncharacterized protein n=1 Tax=Aspergillus sclerotialis TaxID=2070753 RepID=A0A3A2ZTT0_9EURO|nr:hypothetical protein PHISCL_01563 [Aspergillus sclerotialis]